MHLVRVSGPEGGGGRARRARRCGPCRTRPCRGCGPSPPYGTSVRPLGQTLASRRRGASAGCVCRTSTPRGGTHTAQSSGATRAPPPRSPPLCLAPPGRPTHGQSRLSATRGGARSAPACPRGCPSRRREWSPPPRQAQPSMWSRPQPRRTRPHTGRTTGTQTLLRRGRTQAHGVRRV
jgi:hypothetical protein